CYPRSTFYLLSDGLSIQHRRITKSDFRPCSTHRSRSQATLYLYARCPIADRAEVTFELLRYSLGGDRPSQTAQIALSAARIHGSARGDSDPVVTPFMQVGTYPTRNFATLGPS